MTHADAACALGPVPDARSSKYLSPQQVADRLEVCLDTVRKWRLRGVGPCFCRFGNRYRYRLEDVQAFERSFNSAAEADAARGSVIAA